MTVRDPKPKIVAKKRPAKRRTASAQYDNSDSANDNSSSIIYWRGAHYDKKSWMEKRRESKRQNAQKQKAQFLLDLKKSFKPAKDNEEAINRSQAVINEFLINHNQTLDKIKAQFQQLNLPDDLTKRELALRKEMNKHYKNRDNQESKAFAIYIAYEHAKLLLQHPNIEWKNFSGLQKLQSNWKAEEYFDGLLILMHAFQNTFPDSPNADKLSQSIDRTFELWNSRNIDKHNYDMNLRSFSKAINASEKHFDISSIIGYLERCYKFNPQYRDELVEWCKKDIELYEQSLIAFHEYELFTIDEQIQFLDNPKLKQKKLSSISFEQLKRKQYYSVPRLISYDVLESIYEKENDTEKLVWLRGIGEHIGYTERG